MLDSLYNDLPLPQSSGISSSSSSPPSSSTSKLTTSTPSVSLVSSLYGVDETADDVGIAAAAWSAHRTKILAPQSVRKRDASSVSSSSSSSTISSLSSSTSVQSAVKKTNSSVLSPQFSVPSSSSSSTTISYQSNSFPFISPTSTKSILPSSSKLSSSSLKFPSPNSIHSSTTTSTYRPSSTEYDPAKPHDYDKIVKERLHRMQMEELERKRIQEAELRKQEEEENKWKEMEDRVKKHKDPSSNHKDTAFHSSNKDITISLNHRDSNQSSTSESSKHSLKISGEEAFLRRGQLSSFSSYNQSFSSGSSSPPSLPFYNSSSPQDASSSSYQPSLAGSPSQPTEKKSVAARMMEKMGWKHGEGLGRDKQGMTGILIAKKTDKRSGVIVQGGLTKPATSTDPVPSSHSSVSPQSALSDHPPSRIVLLTNLVGKGDVDQDLEGEIQEEASKFGNLLDVQIFEAPQLPDNEAVRIFCAYESTTQANKALTAMNGRVFAGRIVKARFFSEQKFHEGSLEPN